MSTSIFLVDDHPIFLAGLRSLLEDEDDMQVVGDAGDGKTALEKIQRLAPQVVVMDITMPGLNGIEATRKIVSDFPEMKVIALSIHSGKEFVEGMLKAGAIGYIIKESVPEELVKGIRLVMNGEAYLSPSITGLIVSQFRNAVPGEPASSKKKIDIIETKFYPPTVSEDHVHRSRLVSLLEKNRQLTLQNIIAPAGYGKSTLASCWLAKHEWPNAWISLDDDDNDLIRFVYYMISAVEKMFPSAMGGVYGLLEVNTPPPIQALAGRLVAELDRIDQDFILVMDDSHLIKEKIIHDLLAEMLRRPPKRFHLVIIGRSDPFIPIAHFRAQGQLAEIRLNDLKFMPEETEVFINKLSETALEKKLIHDLSERTEGWITGIRLAALSIQHQHDLGTILAKLSSSPKYVMEYLFSEVLAAQPRQVIDYLLKTSILDRFCEPLCKTLFARSGDDLDKEAVDARQFISLLKKDNMFIVGLDTEGNWYRYHHLFQQLLQNQLGRRAAPAEVADLHKRAAAWLSDQGFVDEAIHHALAADDPDSAALIVEKNRRWALDEDQWHALDKWLNRLPDTVKQQRLELLLGKAWILLQQARVAEIIPIMERVEILSEKVMPDLELQSEIYFFQGLICYFQDNSAQSAEFFIKSTEQTSQKISVSLRANAEYWACVALHLDGQKESALQRLHDGIQKRGMQEGMILSRLMFALCFIHSLEGEFPQTLPHSLLMREICQVNRLIFAETWAVYLNGNASFQMLDLETSQQQFSWVMENRYLANPRMGADAMASLAVISQLMGKPLQEVDEIISTAMEYAKWSQDPANIEIVRSCEARIALLRGHLDRAVNWQRSLSKTPGNMMMLFFLEIPFITECRVLVANGSDASLKEAMVRLETLHQKASAWQNTCVRLEGMVLQALCRYHQGQTDKALSVLAEAVSLASIGNASRVFVELGPPMANMLNQLLAKNVSAKTVTQILAAFRKHEQRLASNVLEVSTPPEPAVHQKNLQTLIDPLTHREMEILDLLGQHLYNKEIAEKLFISVETVKTHLKRIYDKLDVGSRRDAVSKAKELSLITRR